MKCEYCGNESQNGLTVCDSCGAEHGDCNNENETAKTDTAIASEPEMKWYKFLIKFLLYLNFVTYLTDAFIYLFGEKIDFLAELFDDIIFTGKFRIIGIIYSVILIILSFIILYVRNGLAKFRVSAPKNFIMLDITTSVLSMIITVLSLVLIENEGLKELLPELFGSILGNTTYAICNIIYFKKRKHLFVNS